MPHNQVRGSEKDFNERGHLAEYWPGRRVTCSDPNQAVEDLAIATRHVRDFSGLDVKVHKGWVIQ